MGQTHAFLSPNLSLQAKSAYSLETLDKETQNHMRVLRISAGEKFSLLDGSGKVFDSEMTSKNEFRVLAVVEVSAPRPSIHLYLSLPKKDSLWEVVSQATELGVSKIIPIASQHNQNPQALRPKLTEKAQKISDEACCQCRQPYRVEIQQNWLSIEDVLKQSQTPMIFADETSARESSAPGIYDAQGNMASISADSGLGLLIGPEGGWSESERKLLKSKAFSMNLGPNVLRVSTATAVAIYHLRHLAKYQR
jgi:16S rRNA (uracil1498-N3)-methyltransferase